MNYILKGVLRKIFTQYLNLHQNKLDLQSGIIKLPMGDINHENLNRKLAPLRLRITSSSYKNLIIHIPLTELTSKPIKLSIEVLDIVVIRTVSGQKPSPHTSPIKREQESTQEQVGKQGYFRNLINRLLYNMEVSMERINLRLIEEQEEKINSDGSQSLQNIPTREASFTLHSLNLRNSLVILEANIVKKSLTLTELHLKHPIAQLMLKDLNLCFDFTNKKISLIAILGTISFEILQLPLDQVEPILRKKKSKKIVESPQKRQTIEMSMYVKVNHIKLSSRLLEVNANNTEVRLAQSSVSQDATLSFQRIYVVNTQIESREKELIWLGYLPCSQQVKLFSEYEDSIIKHCQINIKRLHEGKGSINAKIVHLEVGIDMNEVKVLLDNMVQYQDRIKAIIDILKNMEGQIRQNEPQAKKVSLLFQGLIYRLKFKCIYEQTAITFFGSFKAYSTLLKPFKKTEAVDENSISFKIHQFGGKVKNYSIVDLNQLQGRKTEKDVILNGNSLQVQCSLSLVDSLNEFITHVSRDLAYYKQKFEGIISQYLQNEGKQIQAEGNNLKEQKVRPRIYLKMNQIIIKVGELARKIYLNCQKERKDTEKLLFISIIDLQINSLLVSLISNGLKCNCQVICYLSSPYTLQRTPLTNQLQIGISFNLLTTELQINLKNNLILLLQDQFINIAYKLLDRKNIWCILTNKTHLSISLIQKTTVPVQLPNNISLQTHRIDIGSRESKHVFWLDDESFKLQMGHYMTSSIPFIRDEELQQIEGGRLQAERELQLREDGENQYVLRFIYNKLGNLCELVIDNRLTIQSKTHSYMINFRGHSYSITDDCSMVNWVSELEDLFEDCHEVQFTLYDKHFGVQQLMNNQQFILFGLYEKGAKLYESCIVGMKSLKSMHYTITPFLIIENTISQALEIEIIERKSQERQKIVVKPGQKRQLGHNGKFDYYLKQLTVKIGLLDEQGKISHQGEGLYLNTFFMAAQKTNSPIQLRSIRPQNYSRRLLLLQQSLSLKTKVLTLRSGLYVHNRTAFMVSLRLKDEPTAELSIGPNQNYEWNYRLKNETQIEIVLIGQIQSRIELKYGDLRQMKILSFNFLRIGEGWYNILLRAQARQVQRGQVLQIQSFVQLVNLCQQMNSIFIEDFLEVAADKRSYLPLSATSLNKYNNRCVPIDDLNKIYAQIFLTTKVTDRPLSLKLNGQSLLLGDLVRSSSQELAIANDRYVITLLKDMNGRKITFYLTDRLYSAQAHYTIMANQSNHYFLLSDDSDYAPLFSPSISQSTHPLRLLVPPSSLTCLLNRQPEVLLCDKFEKHLQKATKPALQKKSIKLQRFDFQSITLLEAGEAKSGNIARKQLTTKGIEVRLRMFGRLQVSVGVRLLTVRLLQSGKLDCLLQDIAVKNEQTKDHLLRIPEQTYLLLEASTLRDGHFYLVKNFFLKCKHIIVNIKRQMPYALLPLLQALSARLGGQDKQDNHQQAGRRWGEQILRSKGEEKLRRLVKQLLFLIRTVFIHEVHLSLTIELESISFSNVIILPQFELQQRFFRGRDLQQQLTNYYLTNLLAKFPKLAFLITNFRSPLNTLRLFFNLREALKQKIQTPVLITFPAQPLPQNPFLFSLQRWNNIISCLHSSIDKNQHERTIKLVGALRRENGYLLVSSREILWQQSGQWRVVGLRELQNGRVIRGRGRSELVLRFRKGEKIIMVEEHKNCLKLLGCIQELLL